MTYIRALLLGLAVFAAFPSLSERPAALSTDAYSWSETSDSADLQVHACAPAFVLGSDAYAGDVFVEPAPVSRPVDAPRPSSLSPPSAA